MFNLHQVIGRKQESIDVRIYPPSHATIQNRNERIMKMNPLDVVVLDRINTDSVVHLKSPTELLFEQAANRSLLTCTSNKNHVQNLHLSYWLHNQLKNLHKEILPTKKIFTER